MTNSPCLSGWPARTQAASRAGSIEAPALPRPCCTHSDTCACGQARIHMVQSVGVQRAACGQHACRAAPEQLQRMPTPAARACAATSEQRAYLMSARSARPDLRVQRTRGVQQAAPRVSSWCIRTRGKAHNQPYRLVPAAEWPDTRAQRKTYAAHTHASVISECWRAVCGPGQMSAGVTHI